MPASLTLYFDGQCPLCSREIAYYRKRARPGTAEFVDIAAAGFDPAAEGVDPVRVQKHFHARQDGRLYIGLDAFRAAWSVIPGFRWLRAVTGLPGVYQASKLAYAAFAWVRPYLPKRKGDCSTGACRL